MARNELRFGILGPLEISAGFRSLPLGTPKQRAVLATLIIHRNRPVGIDSLIDAAWEQDRPEITSDRVYVCLEFASVGKHHGGGFAQHLG